MDKSKWLPWLHLKLREGDGWELPHGSTDTDCNLMVQVMESWFLADRNTLKAFFGNGYKEKKIPAASRSIEDVSKEDVYRALADATDDCKTKHPYGKSDHSFKLLAKIDPAKVTAASHWAQRFIDTLKEKMGA